MPFGIDTGRFYNFHFVFVLLSYLAFVTLLNYAFARLGMLTLNMS
jgi:hypothetical protein